MNRIYYKTNPYAFYHLILTPYPTGIFLIFSYETHLIWYGRDGEKESGSHRNSKGEGTAPKRYLNKKLLEWLLLEPTESDTETIDYSKNKLQNRLEPTQSDTETKDNSKNKLQNRL